MTDAPPKAEIVWLPSEELRRGCALTRFMELLRAKGASGVTTFEDLHRWSIAEAPRFWEELVRFVEVKHEGSLSPFSSPEEGPTPLAKKWFPNAQLSFAANLTQGQDGAPAIVSWSENRLQRELSFKELRGLAGAVQGYLQSIGVAEGDRCFAYLPNVPESVVCLLAAASLGASWASCGTDYQIEGLLVRAERVRPTVLVAARSFVWRGQEVDLTQTVQRLVEETPSIKHVVLVDYLQPESGRQVFNVRQGVSIAAYSEIARQPRPFDTSRTFSFSHPLYLMFSSGTTGKPKGIVHGVGGTLLEHKKEMILHGDVRSGDRVFYQTSTSWMMWNWLVSALACDAAVVMYDGDPMLEDGLILWRLADEARVTHFGTSAAFLGALEKQGCNPRAKYAFSNLRALMSTGSTLYPAQFDYISQRIKPLWIQSISGGTDIIGCFGLGCPLKPVVRGEVQGKSLGYDVQVFDQAGSRVINEEGELVCCSPAPSMPVAFLDDSGGAQYRAAYFADYKSVWRHGDLVRETTDGGLVFLGRSDATLKPSGVRVATAEIYAALQGMKRIQQSLAVGYVPVAATSERIVLFVVLAAGDLLDEELSGEIKKTLKASNAFYVPALILQAPDLPRTANNKLSELSVKRILRGDDPGNRSALGNPECLSFFSGEGLRQVKQSLG